MNRVKREIKTPKRFDDEPFETPRSKLALAAKQQAASAKQTPQVKQEHPIAPTSIKPTPTKSQIAKTTPEPKGIIKIKLNRTKQTPTQAKPILSPSIATTSPAPSKQVTPTRTAALLLPKQEVVEEDEIVQLEQEQEPLTDHDDTSAQQQSPSQQIQEDKEKQPVQLKQTPQIKLPPAPKQTTVTPKQPVPSKQSNSVSKQSSSVVKKPQPKQSITPRPYNKISATSKQFEPSDIVSVPRPRRERPRTPPAYGDVIPNIVLPFWDARTAAEDHEDDNVKELVHCHCGIVEELGLMVQCEICLTWQHANCLGIERDEDVPDGYTCQACSDSRFARESKRWAYDQDWILRGRMKQFSCDSNPPSEENVKLLQRINQLIADILKVHQLIHSLKVKSRILTEANDDDPELKLFRNEWPANYQHRDGTQFVPTINHPPGTPTSTISIIGETPDPGDLPMETVVDVGALPDIGQLGDVSAILDNTDLGNTSIQPMTTNHEATPNDHRANLRLHIQQTEEFIGIELAQIGDQLAALEKECNGPNHDNNHKNNFKMLENDLNALRKYMHSINRRN